MWYLMVIEQQKESSIRIHEYEKENTVQPLYNHKFVYNTVMLWLPNFFTVQFCKLNIGKWPFYGHFLIISW